MKQLLFMMMMFAAGGVGSLYHPFWGILLYYALAVLRPQYMWDWALPADVRWSLIAAFMVLVSCMVNFGKLMHRRRFNLVMTLMIIYGGWLLLSLVMAHHPGIAMHWGIEYGKIMLIAFVASIVIRHLWQLRIMTVMILLCLGYVAWEINALYLFDGRLDIFHRGYGGLDNNGAGLMIAMGIPLAYAWAMAARHTWQKAAAAMLGLFMIHAVMMSYSRGAMLAALLATLWLLFHHRPRHHALVLALCGCLVVSVLAGKEIRERFSSTANYTADYSAQSRFDSWAAGWAIACEYPLTGQGIRNSNLYTRNYGADRDGRTIHSNYLQIAADSGIPAMLTYITMLGAAFWMMRRSRLLCLQYLDDHYDENPLDEPDELTTQFIHLSLGCETSLFIFAFGGIFLSLEVFELPWIVLTVAGLMPNAVAMHLRNLRQRQHEQSLLPRLTEHESPFLLPHVQKGLKAT